MADSSPKEKIILPEKYYLTYFLDLIAFVQKHSNHLLDAEDQLFLKQFFSLSENAQCLFIRFINRKGEFFRQDKLSYEEINTSSAISELSDQSFVTPVLKGTEELLPLYTKAELLGHYEHLELKKTIKKEDLYMELISGGDFQPLISICTVVKLEKQEAVEYLKMLFFGHYHAQMTEFVIRDVGHVQLEDLSQHDFKPWFQTLEEAKAVFDISQIRSETRRALQLYPANFLHETLQDIDFKRYQTYDTSRKVMEKLLLTLSQQLEREKEPELALFYYRQCNAHPSRERQIRILNQLGHKEEASQLATEVLDSAVNASELLFAKDYLNKPKVKILRSTTKKLKSSNKYIEVVPDPNQNVESLAIAYFEAEGFQGLHGENYLWRNLFGLTFWEELLDSSYDSYHHPLQRSSSDIHKTDFYTNRKSQLESRLSHIKTRKSWIKQLEQLATSKEGISNRFVYWHPEVSNHMSTMLTYLPLRGAKSMMLEMAKNLKENSKGFPDLLIWKEKEYYFYEVKSPNDQLSAQQLFWIDFMQSKKISVDVLRLKYIDTGQSAR